MIKWNEVTWYSRLGALVLFLAVVPVLCFYVGTQYELTLLGSPSTQSHVLILVQKINTTAPTSTAPQEDTTSTASKTGVTGGANNLAPTSTTPQHYTTSTAPRTDVTEGGTLQKNTSPNGGYVAVSQTDEGGDEAVYIQNSQGTVFTLAYCGVFDSWATTSQKIKVFVPSECLTGNQPYTYFYLSTDGSVAPVEGSTYVPNL